MGKFIIIRKTEGKFEVQLQSKNGFILLRSKEYRSKISCKKAIEIVRISAQDNKGFQKKTTIYWEFYFYLKAANGEIIGTSNTYPSALSREKAIYRIKKLAPTAPVYDQSKSAVY